MELFGYLSAIWFASGFVAGLIGISVDRWKGLHFSFRKDGFWLLMATLLGFVAFVLITSDLFRRR